MDETIYDYLAGITSSKEKSRILVRFTVDSVLLKILAEADEEIYCREVAKEIFSDIIGGAGWHKRVKYRLKNYRLSKRMPYRVFQKLCICLKKDQNLLLNLGRCAFSLGKIPKVFYDPYNTMTPEAYQETELVIR